jgi:hypothetical protein
MTSLADKIVSIAETLETANIKWAIGGAIALAYATEEPRGTRDIDVNIFVEPERVAEVFEVLPDAIIRTESDFDTVRREGQVRLWWDETPIDLFFSSSSFYDNVARRCRVVPFAGTTIHILSAEDLAVFKALFDRPKDWVDIATMVESQSLDAEVAAEWLGDLLGDDSRVARMRQMNELR